MEWREENNKAPQPVPGTSVTVIPPVYVETGATVSDSTVGPSVYVGARARIRNSVVQDSVVYDDCQVERCDLRGSVLGGGSVVQGIVHDSLLGPTAH